MNKSYDEKILNMLRTREQESEIAKGWMVVCTTQHLRYDSNNLLSRIIDDASCFGFRFKGKNGIIYAKEIIEK